MAYFLRYNGTLIDHFGRTVEVKIYENNYTGSSEVVTLAGINKNFNGSDEDLFVSKIGSEISVGLLSETDFKYIDLYTGNARKYKLQVEIDSVLDWTGWIIPENFTEPYDGTPYITTVSARCGLGELSSHNFDLMGVKTHYEILVDIISKIGTPSIYLGVNIFEENQVTTDSPLIQTYVDCERYSGLNCEDVLDDLLNLYGARIYQSEGAWWFVNVVEFESTINMIKYNFFLPKDEITKDTELLIGRPKDNKFANTDQTLNILPAWKERTVIRDLDFKDSALNNYDFDNWEKSGNDYSPSDWRLSEKGIVTRYSAEDKISLRYTVYNSTPTDYGVSQLIDNIEGGKHGIKLNISFKAIKITPEDLLVSTEFWVKIENNDLFSNTKYLTDGGLWSDTEAFINFQNVDVDKLQDSAFKTYELPNSEVIPYDGNVVVTIYPSKGSYLIVDYCRVQLTFPEIIPLSADQFGAYPDEPITDFYSISENTYIPEDLELLTGDFPDLINTGVAPYNGELNEQHMYKGGLYLLANKNQVSTNWSKLPADYTNKRNLHEIVIKDRVRKTTLPQWAITGTILAKNIKIDSTLVDYQVNNNKYLVCNGNYDMENCFFNGTYILIGSYGDAPWILDEGVWNDDGIWKDDSVWYDSDPTP